ncbi:UNVERIFIED_CONTAM: hypothetical protein DES50_10542 [Williamsia faeni]
MTPAIFSMLEKLEGVATWRELRELLPRPEVERELLHGAGGRITWMSVGSAVVGVGGWSPPSEEDRIEMLLTLRTGFQRSPGFVYKVVAEAFGESEIGEVPVPRLREIWAEIAAGRNDLDLVVDAQSRNTAAAREDSQSDLDEAEPRQSQPAQELPDPIPVEPISVGNDMREPASEAEPKQSIIHQKSVAPKDRSSPINDLAMFEFAKHVAARKGTAVRLQPGSTLNSMSVTGVDGGQRIVLVEGKRAGNWRGHRSDATFKLDGTRPDVRVFVDVADRFDTKFYIIDELDYADRVRSDMDRWVRKDEHTSVSDDYPIRPSLVVTGMDRWELLDLEDYLDGILLKSVGVETPRTTVVPVVESVLSPPVEVPIEAGDEASPDPDQDPAAASMPPANLSPYVNSLTGRKRCKLAHRGHVVSGIVSVRTRYLTITRAPRFERLEKFQPFRNPATAAAAVKSAIENRVVFGYTDDWLLDDGSERVVSEVLSWSTR